MEDKNYLEEIKKYLLKGYSLESIEKKLNINESKLMYLLQLNPNYFKNIGWRKKDEF
ncbi:hypothetical protein [Fusobacterium sp.]|uniref:hypothetical protein n=1 Tax=Fusobacterium sp. TaxID=68766 RepID=UPI0026377E3E|nr:hypothetical protein [Fusobacterium sp.]